MLSHISIPSLIIRMASCGDDMRHRLWELHGDCGGDDPALFAEDGQGYYAGTAEMTPLHYRSDSKLTHERIYQVQI